MYSHTPPESHMCYLHALSCLLLEPYYFNTLIIFILICFLFNHDSLGLLSQFTVLVLFLLFSPSRPAFPFSSYQPCDSALIRASEAAAGEHHRECCVLPRVARDAHNSLASPARRGGRGARTAPGPVSSQPLDPTTDTTTLSMPTLLILACCWLRIRRAFIVNRQRRRRPRPLPN